MDELSGIRISCAVIKIANTEKVLTASTTPFVLPSFGR